MVKRHGGHAKPRNLWYKDLGAIPGEPYLFYPVKGTDISTAVAIIYEKESLPHNVFFVEIGRIPIRNPDGNKDYFDTEEEAMTFVERYFAQAGAKVTDDRLDEWAARMMSGGTARSLTGCLLTDEAFQELQKVHCEDPNSPDCRALGTAYNELLKELCPIDEAASINREELAGKIGKLKNVAERIHKLLNEIDELRKESADLMDEIDEKYGEFLGSSIKLLDSDFLIALARIPDKDERSKFIQNMETLKLKIRSIKG